MIKIFESIPKNFDLLQHQKLILHSCCQQQNFTFTIQQMATMTIYLNGTIRTTHSDGLFGLWRRYISLQSKHKHFETIVNLTRNQMSFTLNQPLHNEYDIYEDRLIAWQFDDTQKVLSFVFATNYCLFCYSLFLNKNQPTHLNIRCYSDSNANSTPKYMNIYQQWENFGVHIKFTHTILKSKHNFLSQYSDNSLLQNLIQNPKPII